MPRIRTVKPEHWSDKNLTKLTLQAHLFWIGTWNFSDDKGIFESDPFLLRSQVFPRRTDIRIDQVEQWISQLTKAGFIIPFTYKEVGYCISRTFATHQRIDRPTPSKIPDEEIRRVLDECSRGLDLYSIVEDRRVEDSINGELNFSFDQYWNLYDKKVGDKEKLEKKWRKLSDFERKLIMDYIPKYKSSTPDKQYRKDPATFLNGKAWNDELIGVVKKFDPFNPKAVPV
jgi:hypothetical protein